ncbi:MAG TPA: hypothetical protein VND93_22410 [Myxococcales bacterium]|nr:hypothetical protein [Myxococcales bacterium]
MSRETGGGALVAAALLLCSCGPPSSPFDPVVVPTTFLVKDAPAFADERGDAMLIDSTDALIRVRADGNRGALEPHPGNPSPVGAVRAVFPMGPHGALVAAAGGLFVAQEGWIIDPGWASSIDSAGVTGAADPGDGTAWIASQSGLFQVNGGVLSELKVGGQSVTGITALAAAPAEDGSAGIWYSDAAGLHVVEANASQSLVVRSASLGAGDGKNALSLVALGDGERSRGELWLLSASGLFRLSAGGWRSVGMGAQPEGLAARGRVAWVSAGGKLWRYDADRDAWEIARGLTGLRLLAADAAGGAWISFGGTARSVGRDRVPRLVGLDEGEVMAVSDLTVRALPPPGADALTVTYQLETEQVVAGPSVFSLGGEAPDGSLLSYSLLGLASGPHTLRATAQYSDGTEATREVPFQYTPYDNATLSWATDIYPIHVDRCSRCHDTGPGHDLSTYELWKADAARIAQAVSDRRMPADGPLDPLARTKIIRWAQTGAAP